MDSLRPDLDDLKQYKNRQDGNKKNTKRSASPNTDVSSIKVESRSGLSIFARLMIFLLCVGCGGLGYLAWTQQQNLMALNSKVLESDEFISQSKLLMARLEGELSETGAELEQSGTDAQKKLAFLDSEMRKLWGVSNDRNKKSIKDNRADIDKLASSVSAQKKSLATVGGDVKSVRTQVKSIDGRIATMSGEASIIRSEQDEKITQLQKMIDTYAKNEAQLLSRISALEEARVADEKVMAELKPSLAAINESRRQLVNRVVNLETKVDKAIAPPKKADLKVTP